MVSQMASLVSPSPGFSMATFVASNFVLDCGHGSWNLRQGFPVDGWSTTSGIPPRTVESKEEVETSHVRERRYSKGRRWARCLKIKEELAKSVNPVFFGDAVTAENS